MASDPYRDELEAAHQRIAQLERELVVRKAPAALEHARLEEPERLPRLHECLDRRWIIDRKTGRNARAVGRLLLNFAAQSALLVLGLWMKGASFIWLLPFAMCLGLVGWLAPQAGRRYAEARLAAVDGALRRLQDATLADHEALTRVCEALSQELVRERRARRVVAWVITPIALALAAVGIFGGSEYGLALFVALVLFATVSLTEEGARTAGIEVIGERYAALTTLSWIAPYLGPGGHSATTGNEVQSVEDESEEEAPARALASRA